MPDLHAFADFARSKRLVPRSPSQGNNMGNGVFPEITAYVPILKRHVPRVPRQIDTDTQKVDWWAFFDERAGIWEYDGELARPDAERLAYADTVAALGPEPGTR